MGCLKALFHFGLFYLSLMIDAAVHHGLPIPKQNKPKNEMMKPK